jgi:hypothetical protein
MLKLGHGAIATVVRGTVSRVSDVTGRPSPSIRHRNSAKERHASQQLASVSKLGGQPLLISCTVVNHHLVFSGLVSSYLLPPIEVLMHRFLRNCLSLLRLPGQPVSSTTTTRKSTVGT